MGYIEPKMSRKIQWQNRDQSFLMAPYPVREQPGYQRQEKI